MEKSQAEAMSAGSGRAKAASRKTEVSRLPRFKHEGGKTMELMSKHDIELLIARSKLPRPVLRVNSDDGERMLLTAAAVRRMREREKGMLDQYYAHSYAYAEVVGDDDDDDEEFFPVVDALREEV